ncbi:MAG: hypothetical protein RLZZ398_679 [Verrucomicrobiota bacterium]|jgi:hypothetical protein
MEGRDSSEGCLCLSGKASGELLATGRVSAARRSPWWADGHFIAYA